MPDSSWTLLDTHGHGVVNPTPNDERVSRIPMTAIRPASFRNLGAKSDYLPKLIFLSSLDTGHLLTFIMAKVKGRWLGWTKTFSKLLAQETEESNGTHTGYRSYCVP